MTAVLFGSISTVADTSELQRNAFNQAFAEHGLDWQWDQAEYRELLQNSGGQQRIADYADSRGQDVDAKAVHDTKSKLFQDNLVNADLEARDGVADTIRAARAQGAKVGLVSGTARENLSALLATLEPDIKAADFDVILDADSVVDAKPDPAIYAHALEQLGEQPGDCIAIEDNVPGVEAAVAAGIVCVAFPNENTESHDFGSAQHRVDRIDFDQLQQFLRGE